MGYNDEIADNSALVVETSDTNNLPTKTEEAVIKDAQSTWYNVILSAFISLLTVIAITGTNAHAGLSLLLAVMSGWVALQSYFISGKSFGRFFKYGFSRHKSVGLLATSFVLSTGIAMINIYEAMKVFGFVETGYFN